MVQITVAANIPSNHASESHHVAQAALKLINSPASASQVLAFKVCVTAAWHLPASSLLYLLLLSLL